MIHAEGSEGDAVEHSNDRCKTPEGTSHDFCDCEGGGACSQPAISFALTPFPNSSAIFRKILSRDGAGVGSEASGLAVAGGEVHLKRLFYDADRAFKSVSSL